MSEHQFLPWMRVGLAAAIPANGSDGVVVPIAPRVRVRADDDVHDAGGPQIRMRGPGDVIALNLAEIKRREPQPGAVGAETNYFCSVEFFAPDLPWRYSPAAVDRDGRLAPWLVLVVVELGPEVELSTGGRLPVLDVADVADQLPDLAESWAWAHVQAATTLDGGVDSAYARDPGAFSSRLLCPRRLQPDTAYTACLVPAYEAGRRAGLGDDPGDASGPAWTNGRAVLPVYDSWQLTAGDRFDFKTLARRIKPAEVPADVGLRELDLSDMGTGMRPLRSTATFVGAMHAPTDALVHWHDASDRSSFEEDVRTRLVTTPPRGGGGSGYDPLVDDPAVAPPAYGAPQVGTNVVPETLQVRRGWFEELNVAPHHRAVAGLGAAVVRADQEALMAAAWEQAKAALDVNRKLNRGRISQESARQSDLKWERLDDATVVSIAAPALVAMRVDGTTAKRLVEASDAPSAYFGAAFRRLGCSNGPLATAADVPAARSPAMEIARAAVHRARGAAPPDALSIAFRTRYLPAGMDVGYDLFARATGARPEIDGDVVVTVPRDSAAFVDRAGRNELRRRARSVPVVEARTRAARPAARTTTPVDITVEIDDLDLELETFEFHADRPITKGRIATTPPGAAELGFDLVATVRAAVQPARAIADSVWSQVIVPSGVGNAASVPTRVGLEPRFADPMYERVRALSVDYLVPGVGAVPHNTLSLLEINPSYVEAFMVGLNHEMSRELRWREYPATLEQTWFQHFFDNVEPAGSVDIRAVDRWDAKAPLGREYGQGTTPGLVLLIKADLLRKYPDVRVYAVPAVLDDTGDRVPDFDAAAAVPNFVGALQRGVNFYGFETLTEEAARGDGANEEGWFFVLEEEPRAMRFGLDRGRQEAKGKVPATWANLAWAHLATGEGAVPWFCSVEPPNRDIPGTVRDDLEWGDGAAVMAAITFRQPIQVCMHASAMLPEAGDA